ncbi:hypothetical protein [Nocardia aurantiaca]|uniref:Uncharacterized protein n=1 Tax=Nocardia aurantiaca TaxID=2675850 RepID=A0A6I3L6G6_9NOCA|nr:hypothetical protein [Nocardia aurantiaca]MTE16938.1 hypothetical protein [Nocardia aurantiaca]
MSPSTVVGDVLLATRLPYFAVHVSGFGSSDPPADLLAELGRGEIELTHEAFHKLPWRAAATP